MSMNKNDVTGGMNNYAGEKEKENKINGTPVSPPQPEFMFNISLLRNDGSIDNISVPYAPIGFLYVNNAKTAYIFSHIQPGPGGTPLFIYRQVPCFVFDMNKDNKEDQSTGTDQKGGK